MSTTIVDTSLTAALEEVAAKIPKGQRTAHLKTITETSQRIIGEGLDNLRDLLTEIDGELNLTESSLVLSMGRKVVHGNKAKPHIWGAYIPNQVRAASHVTPQLYIFRDGHMLGWGVSPSDKALLSPKFMSAYKSVFKKHKDLVDFKFSEGFRGRHKHEEDRHKKHIVTSEDFFTSDTYIFARIFETKNGLPSYEDIKGQVLADFKELLPMYLEIVDACRNAGSLDATRIGHLKNDWLGDWQEWWKGKDGVESVKVPDYMQDRVKKWESMKQLWEFGKTEAVYAALVSMDTDQQYQERVNALLFGPLRRTAFTGQWRSAVKDNFKALAKEISNFVTKHNDKKFTQQDYEQLISKMKEICGFELHSFATRFLCDLSPNKYLPISRKFTVEALKKTASLFGLDPVELDIKNYPHLCEEAQRIAANFPGLPDDEKIYVLDHFLYWYSQVYTSDSENEDSVWDDEDEESAVGESRFWKISCGRGGKYASEHRNAGLVSIGWSEVGDLSKYTSKDQLKADFETIDNRGYDAGYATDQAWKISKEMKPGDYVFGYGSGTVLLVGRVSGDYMFQEVSGWARDSELVQESHRNTRPVAWINVDPIETSVLPQKLKKKLERNQTIVPLTSEEGEQILQAIGSENYEESVDSIAGEREILTLHDVARETGKSEDFLHRLETRLLKKQQIILYGPPGTSKTHFAKNFANYFLNGSGLYQSVQFHPSYSYEDFIEGFRPSENGGSPFQRKKGVFKEFCDLARGRQNERFLFVIDEINRGNLPQIFGELLYLLEYRDEETTLPYSKSPFSIPSNVYIIGTMNTADRSIAMVDFALRRRFEFFDFGPDLVALESYLNSNGCKEDVTKVVSLLKRLNDRIGDELGKHYKVGHTFFMKPNLDYNELSEIWEFSVIPLIEEYFYENEDAVKEFDLESLWKSVTQAA